MLRNIFCPLFKKQSIDFHDGLNVVLGDDNANNSIGKSSALIAIDFCFGGNSLLDDKSGAIKAMGSHRYDFSFSFSGQDYYFSRSTDASEIVYICDKNYLKTEEISLDDFRNKLKILYSLSHCESSFRSIVGPFSRIWGRDTLDVDHPFVGAKKEGSGVAVERLVDLFGFSEKTSDEKKSLNQQRETRRLINSAMSQKIIPGISKTQYNKNLEIINDNVIKVDFLKESFGGALTVYDSLFDGKLRELHVTRNQLESERSEIQTKIRRLEREIAGITPRLAANIALVAEFFPNVNVAKLEQVESFHRQIGSSVKKQLKVELDSAQEKLGDLSGQIREIDHDIQNTLSAKGVPDDIFNRVFELKDATDRAQRENNYFTQKIDIGETIAISQDRLDRIYSTIFLEIEHRTNERLRAFNRVVYGPDRNSSQLRISSPSSYTFSSPDDTGTGKSFAGLIGFDLAMLSLTALPFLIHDSVLYKNIEIAATRRILRILASVKKKQIFLAFDEAKKFGTQTESLLRKAAVLSLSHKDMLYSSEWRTH